MPKKEQSEAMISESGNWNVADVYSKSKIMRPLNLCDLYEDIARFGYESIIDELANWQSPPNDYIRYKGLQRLLRELIRLIDNTKFALKKGKTKKTVLEFKEQLQKIEKVIPELMNIRSDETIGTKTISISNLDLFEKVLNRVAQIKSKINEPLNQNHLIFTDKEEFDPKVFKENMKRRMVEQG